MNDCKVKISVDVCGESALNKVSLLIAEQDKTGDMSPKLSIRDICKQVAEEFNASNEGAHVKWETLRKAYQRAQKVGTCPQSNTTDKVTICNPHEKELVPLDVPMINSTTIDTTKYITIEEHNRIIFEYEKASFEDAERFTKIISELEKQLQSKHISKEEANVLIMDQPPEESTLINRSTVFNFIKKYGNEFQCMALKDDNLPNEKLFKVFVKVREQYKTSTPPPAWNKEIINATGILSF